MTCSQSRLKSCLDYDPSSGLFRWKVSPAYTVSAGRIAGWKGPKGSVRIEFDRKNYLAHRLAWFYVHGEWPAQIDHINGDRNDNRLANLRPANNSENQANMPAKSNSKLGIRGVGYRRGRYVVQMKKTKNGKTTTVQRRFKTLDEARSFSIATSKKLHGDFSIYNR